MVTAEEQNKKIISAEIEKQNNRKDFYNHLTDQLHENGDTQISTSDPDSRQMITRNNITEVAYNVQTVMDAKHCLPIDYKVTNENDSKAMGAMLRRTKTILQHNNFTALYDKGYHTGSEIKKAVEMGIDIMVAIPGVAAFAPDDNYNFDKFIYNEKNDTYTCPQQQTLITNGNWYQKSKQRYIYFVKHYKTNACKGCPALALCTKNKKRIQRASADVGLMFTAYNLRRLINIIDKNLFKKFLRELWLVFFTKTSFLKAIKHFVF